MRTQGSGILLLAIAQVKENQQVIIIQSFVCSTKIIAYCKEPIFFNPIAGIGKRIIFQAPIKKI